MAAAILTRKQITHTVTGRVTIQAKAESFGSDSYLALWGIESDDVAENRRLQEVPGGDLCCWDAVITFHEGRLEIHGADGPGGGRHAQIALIIPDTHVASLTIERE